MDRHLFAPYRSERRPGPQRYRGRAAQTGWHRLMPLLLLALLGPVACDSSTSSPASDQANVDTDSAVDADSGAQGAGQLGDSVPPCPFTAAQVSDLLGRTMADQGNCLFGDGKGVASLTVTMASQTAGAMTYDYQYQQAGQRFERVVDLDRGDRSYIAAKDIEGEAVLISDKGSYTLIMSSFGLDVAAYEQKLRQLLDAIPS